VFIFAYSYYNPLYAKSANLNNEDELKIHLKDNSFNSPPNDNQIETVIKDSDNEQPEEKKSEDDNEKINYDNMSQVAASFLTFADFKEASSHQNSYQKLIQEAIRHSWEGYRRFSWGHDHLKPLSKTGHNWFRIGLTILDSMDTLLMAGMEKGNY